MGTLEGWIVLPTSGLPRELRAGDDPGLLDSPSPLAHRVLPRQQSLATRAPALNQARSLPVVHPALLGVQHRESVLHTPHANPHVVVTDLLQRIPHLHDGRDDLGRQHDRDAPLELAHLKEAGRLGPLTVNSSELSDIP